MFVSRNDVLFGDLADYALVHVAGNANAPIRPLPGRLGAVHDAYTLLILEHPRYGLARVSTQLCNLGDSQCWLVEGNARRGGRNRVGCDLVDDRMGGRGGGGGYICIHFKKYRFFDLGTEYQGGISFRSAFRARNISHFLADTLDRTLNRLFLGDADAVIS